jgi:hypothetical protein
MNKVVAQSNAWQLVRIIPILEICRVSPNEHA